MHAKPALYCQVAARVFEPEGGAGGNNSMHERLVWLPRAQGQDEDASLSSTLSRDSEGVSLNSA